MTTGTTDFTIRSGFSTPMVEIPMPLFAVPYAAPKSICMFIKTIHNRIDLISNCLEFSLFYRTLNLLANDNTFKEQVRDVLMEFKIQYYVGIIEAQIREKEVEMEKVSTAYTAEVAGNQKAGKSVGTGSARQSLQKLTQLAYELEALKRSLNKIR